MWDWVPRTHVGLNFEVKIACHGMRFLHGCFCLAWSKGYSVNLLTTCWIFCYEKMHMGKLILLSWSPFSHSNAQKEQVGLLMYIMESWMTRSGPKIWTPSISNELLTWFLVSKTICFTVIDFKYVLIIVKI